ncbi:MAG: hypothetical protein ABJF11_11240 [Reichenbachiella sp.]|uniref:hypothetical protein n=1 Tax=Reichenbachiella sp. TaxID=2184521 RepID=UPI003267DFB0
MKSTKLILLFLLLVLPVLVYLFLQGFGKNHFAIPVYYQQGLTKHYHGCDSINTNEAYRIDRSALNLILDEDLSASIAVYEIGNRDSETLKNNLYTFLEKYKEKSDVKLISIKKEMDTTNFTSKYSSWKRFNLPDSDLINIGRCILQLNFDSTLKSDSGLVLVDRQQQIRGYYDPYVLKEIDRLNTELYILLSE